MTKPKTSRKSGLALPVRTSWIDVVPGAKPPTEVLLVLLQELGENGYNLCIGIYDEDLNVFLDHNGSAVEVMGKVTKYHLLIAPSGKRFMVRYDD